jgi:hypothetical protein
MTSHARHAGTAQPASQPPPAIGNKKIPQWLEFQDIE